jgi:hypothetical protein
MPRLHQSRAPYRVDSNATVRRRPAACAVYQASGEVTEVDTKGKPVAIDLCCGDGGFTDGLMAAGFYVVGVDLMRFDGYKGDELITADLLTVSSGLLGCYSPAVVFAGPPCEQYSRHGMPWTRKRNPPPPDMRLVRHCFGLASALGVPIVLENVRAAQQWIGRAVTHYGPHYLWGDVPALIPDLSMYSKRPKESFSSSQRHLRARVPFELSYHLAKCFAVVAHD